MHLMDNCSHIFHKKCLMDYFLGQIKSKKIPILCPEQNCNKEVAMFDLKHILSSKDI
jgi:hypothetical protein